MNLDIKNGLVMMVSVIMFTILGSWISSLLPNTVLGGSSYVMTFIMGLRFLISPITKTRLRICWREPIRRRQAFRKYVELAFGDNATEKS